MLRRPIKRANHQNLLQSLIKNGPIPRAVIAEDLGLTPASVSRLVRDLIDVGMLAEGEELPTTGRPGRKFVQVGFAQGNLFVIGIGFEAFSQSIVLSDLNGTVVQTRSLGLSEFADIDLVARVIALAIEDLLATTGISRSAIIGVGLAIVGTVDRAQGRVVYSDHLGWTDVPIGQVLEASLGLPVAVENLLHATNLAEHVFGQSKNHNQVLLIRGSLSIGASIIVNQQIVRGSQSRAGQIAHAPLAGAKKICSCGGRGCLETEASGRAVIANFTEMSYAKIAADDIGDLSEQLTEILHLAEDKDSDAFRALIRSGHALGVGLRYLLLTLDPESIVLSGPIGRHPGYVKGVLQGINSHLDLNQLRKPEILISDISSREIAARIALMEFILIRELDLELLGRCAKHQLKFNAGVDTQIRFQESIVA